MKDKIVTGQIKDLDTGETHEIAPFYLFRGGFELNTFIKILNVESYLHPDNSKQISVDCLALDGCGFVFKLTIDFTPERLEDELIILSDITVGKILAVHGDYSVLPDEKGGISLHNPTYSPLPTEYSREEIEEVFRVNNLADKNRLI
ncbi:MAG: hypothetical protein ABSD50_08705 [Smithella sp.]|jgi:hypothetical protein